MTFIDFPLLLFWVGGGWQVGEWLVGLQLQLPTGTELGKK